MPTRQKSKLPSSTRISNEVLSVQVQHVGERVDAIDTTLAKVADSLSAFGRLDERLTLHMLEESAAMTKLNTHDDRLVEIDKKLIPLMATRRWLLWGVSGIAGMIGVQSFNAWTNVQSMYELQRATASAKAAADALPVAAERIQRTLETPIEQRRVDIPGTGIQAEVARKAAESETAHVKAGNP